MLVLSRKVGQSIIIDDEIQVTVVEVRGNRVRLAIRAPDSVRIYREELVVQSAAAEAESVRHQLAGVSG